LINTQGDCSGAFLFRDGLVLLGLRSHNRTSAPGLWDAIGGHIEALESPEQALSRELFEEIQIVPTEFRILGILSDPSPHDDGSRQHIFVVNGWTGLGPVLTGDEHAEIRWFKIDDAIKLDLAHPGYVEILRSL
jgi:8-oxo-dGTP pyrophosphatase MutT (NUDIX family)